MTTTFTGTNCFAGDIYPRLDISGSKLTVRDKEVSGWFHFEIADPIEEPHGLGKEEITVGQLKFSLTYSILFQMWYEDYYSVEDTYTD
jgi:hypothetical protein